MYCIGRIIHVPTSTNIPTTTLNLPSSTFSSTEITNPSYLYSKTIFSLVSSLTSSPSSNLIFTSSRLPSTLPPSIPSLPSQSSAISNNILIAGITGGSIVIILTVSIIIICLTVLVYTINTCRGHCCLKKKTTRHGHHTSMNDHINPSFPSTGNRQATITTNTTTVDNTNFAHTQKDDSMIYDVCLRPVVVCPSYNNNNNNKDSSVMEEEEPIYDYIQDGCPNYNASMNINPNYRANTLKEPTYGEHAIPSFYHENDASEGLSVVKRGRGVSKCSVVEDYVT